MADNCSLYKKKIGILDKSGAKTYPGGVVCGSCVKQINKALSVYYQNLDGYTRTQLEVVYSRISELLVHGTELEKINSRYDEIIAPVKTKLRKCEFDLPALKQTVAKESQKRRSECQKEMEQLNREEGRDSDGKKIRWNTEERKMLKEQKYYLRKGMKLEADNIDAIFARQDDTYWKFIQGLAEELEKGEKSGNLILEGAEKEIEAVQAAGDQWTVCAAQTMLLDRAIEYVQTPKVPHTANEWKPIKDGQMEISNLVYVMRYKISQQKDGNHKGQWLVTWGIALNRPPRPKTEKYYYAGDVMVVDVKKKYYNGEADAQH